MTNSIKIILAIASWTQAIGFVNNLDKIKACQQESSINNPECDRLAELVTKLAQKKGSLESLDLSKLNLAGVNLVGANLAKANLEGSDLSGSNLQNANLDLANIDRANFSQANLAGIKRKADSDNDFAANSFLEVNFQGANLENVDFGRGQFDTINFIKANLRRAKLEGVLWGNDFTDANLQQAVMRGRITSTFTRANLSYADLSGVYITETSFKNANFYNTNLVATHFASNELDGSSFHNANLSRAIFSVYYGSSPSTTLIGADFSNANLKGSSFDSYTNFKNTNLTGANLAGAIIIRPENLTPTQVKSACNWEDATYNFDPNRHPHLQKAEEDLSTTQKYIQQLKQDRASDPKEPIDCDRWK